jgi:hypothetical protein
MRDHITCELPANVQVIYPLTLTLIVWTYLQIKVMVHTVILTTSIASVLVMTDCCTAKYF